MLIPLFGFLCFYAMAKKIEQPTEEQQAEMISVRENKADVVMLRDRKIYLKWIRPCVRMWMSEIILNEKDETKVGAKCAAVAVLNGYWAYHLFFWFLWRWFYYIKQYNDEDYIPLMELCKKKLGAENYYLLTILMTGMKDTMIAMTRKETERFLREQK